MNEDEYIRRFGERIYNLRIKKDLSQQYIADIANIPRTQLGRIERGEINTTLRTAFKLAKAFKMDVSRLTDLSDDCK